MKKYNHLISFFLCIAALLFTGCVGQTTAGSALTADQVAALREEYPLVEIDLPLTSKSQTELSDHLNVSSTNFEIDFVVAEFVDGPGSSASSYVMEPDSPEAQLDERMGGNGTQEVSLISFRFKPEDSLFTKIPERFMDSDGCMTVIVGAAYAGSLPDFVPGNKYGLILAFLNENSTFRKDKINNPELCAEEIFYITPNGHLLSANPDRDNYSGLSLDAFQGVLSDLRSDALDTQRR